MDGKIEFKKQINAQPFRIEHLLVIAEPSARIVTNCIVTKYIVIVQTPS